MSKNKDDEFDFEWDDESSFDSSLDNFGGDVDDYTGEEIRITDFLGDNPKYDMRCMKDLTVKQVLDACEKWLE